ncbi:hypothetical protein HZ326_1795 [Fusarium oxysporum f. sp. albedinis]|nr:hypothetical protein HZ326_1795 [Fusarium oxysporum f. sp. albedinis]
MCCLGISVALTRVAGTLERISGERRGNKLEPRVNGRRVKSKVKPPPNAQTGTSGFELTNQLSKTVCTYGESLKGQKVKPRCLSGTGCPATLHQDPKSLSPPFGFVYESTFHADNKYRLILNNMVWLRHFQHLPAPSINHVPRIPPYNNIVWHVVALRVQDKVVQIYDIWRYHKSEICCMYFQRTSRIRPFRKIRAPGTKLGSLSSMDAFSPASHTNAFTLSNQSTCPVSEYQDHHSQSGSES